MREVKFRGKAAIPIKDLDMLEIPHQNGWVYGALIYNEGDPYIISPNVVESCEEYFNPEWWYPVEPDSVGQYTGWQDVEKTEVYEGDIIHGTFYGYETVAVVTWDKSGYWTYKNPTKYKEFKGGYLTDLRNIRVIGNIFELPDYFSSKKDTVELRLSAIAKKGCKRS